MICIVYYAHVFEKIVALLLDIQGVPGGMCQTSGGCSLC